MVESAPKYDPCLKCGEQATLTVWSKLAEVAINLCTPCINTIREAVKK